MSETRDMMMVHVFLLINILVVAFNVYLYFISWKIGLIVTICLIALLLALLFLASYGVAKINMEQESYYRY